MPTYPAEAWERLGDKLIERRVQLDPRYEDRKVFCAEVGLGYHVVMAIENAKRTTFRPATLASIEIKYRWKSGSIRDVLAGGEPTPAPGSPGSLTVVEPHPVPDYPDEIGDDPYLRRLIDDPYAPDDEKWAAIYGVIAHRAAVRRSLQAERRSGKPDETQRA